MKCKVCGFRLNEGVPKCPVCGAISGSTKAGNIAKDANLPRYFCPSCKAEIIGEHRYCPACMKELSEAAKTVGIKERGGNNCIKCGVYLPAGAKFCHECGTKQESHCTHCGATIMPNAKFCHECGAKQEAAPNAKPTKENGTNVSGGVKETPLDAFEYEVRSGKYILTGVKDNSLTDIVIPSVFSELEGDCEENTFFLRGVFDGCKKLKSVTISETITRIGTAAFAHCESLTNIAIPHSVIEIEEFAFSYSGLTSIIIPHSVIKISRSTFENCETLRDVIIPNSVTEIGTLSFAASGLMSIIIPDSVTKIDDYAFAQCKNLTNVTIPNSVTKISHSTFVHCSSLTNIVIPHSVIEIGGAAFSYSGLTSIIIPDSVTKIGSHAFWGCESLTNITIPYSVTEIGARAFLHCASLKTVSIENSKFKKSDIARVFGDLPSFAKIKIGNKVVKLSELRLR